MTPENDQEQLSDLFEDLRRDDARHARPFEQHWQAALTRLQQPAVRWTTPTARWAAAAAIILAAGVTTTVLLRGPGVAPIASERTELPPVVSPQQPVASASQPRESPPTASMEDWESPTAALLELAGDEWSTQDLDERF